MTIREIGRVLGMSQAHRVGYGTPAQLADDMQEWLEAGACDGFNLLFAHYPSRWKSSSTSSCPNCNGAASSAPNTRPRHCAAISACRCRKIRLPRDGRWRMPERQLKLGAFLSTPGNHLAGWRHPSAVTTTDMDFREYVHLARIAEAAKYDTIFFQDTAAVNAAAPSPAAISRARS